MSTMSTDRETRTENPNRQPPHDPNAHKGAHTPNTSAPSMGIHPPPVPSKFLMNDIPRGTSYANLINSLLVPSHHDSSDQTSPADKLRPHVLCGLIITDSILDDELSVATLEFSDTPKWLLVLNRDPCGFPKHTPLGTLWRGVDRHATDPLGQSEFIRAVIRGNAGMGLYYAEMLAEFSDTNVNIQDYDGRTALHWACAGSLQDMVRLCLSVPGIQVGLRDKNGFTAFDLARQSGDEVVPTLFYSSMLQLDESDPQAALLGVLTMSSESAGGAEKPIFPGAAMFEPIEALNEKLVEALITRGVDLTARNKEGDTALHVAVKTGGVEIVARLLGAGSDVNAIGDGGATPLHHVTRAAGGDNSQLDIARLLLRHGADLDLKNTSGLTALQLAEENELAALVLVFKTVKMDDRLVPYPLVVRKEELPAPIAAKQLQIKTKVPMKEVLPAPLGNTALRVEKGVTKAARPVLDPLAEKRQMVRALLGDIDAKLEKGRTALHLAVRRGDLEGVLVLLQLDANKEAKDEDSCTALHLAAKHGYARIVKALLDSGGRTERRTGWGDTALHLAATGDFPDTVRALLDGGAKLEAMSGSRDTALHLAATRGYAETVKILLDGGASYEAVSHKGDTALHLAVKGGFTEAVKALLDGGANVEAKTLVGNTAMHLAATGGFTETVKALLEGGAKTETMSRAGDTALHLAVRKGHAATVKVLVTGGAEIGAMNSKGFTALHLTARLGERIVSENPRNEILRLVRSDDERFRRHNETLTTLLECGAKLEAFTPEGYTALHLSAMAGFRDTVHALLEGGAQIETRGPAGYTALHMAANQGTSPTVRTLVLGGAQIEAMTDNGYTALHLVAKRNRADFETIETVTILLEHGAQIEARSPDGTAMQIASKQGARDVMEILRARGAARTAVGRFGNAMISRLGRKDPAK